MSHAYPNPSFTSNHEIVQNRIQRGVKKRPCTVRSRHECGHTHSCQCQILDWGHRLTGRRSQSKEGNHLTYYLRLSMVICQICIYAGGATK